METKTKGELKSQLSYLFNRSERLYWALKENRIEDAKDISDDIALQIGHGESVLFREANKEIARRRLQDEYGV